MKDFFKKHPEFIALIVVVVVVDLIVVWMTMGDMEKTEAEKKKKDSFSSKVSAIKNTNYKLSQGNETKALAVSNAKKEEYDKRWAVYAEKYKPQMISVVGLDKSSTKQRLTDIVDEMISAVGKDGTSDKLSFLKYYDTQTVMVADAAENQKLFDVLSGAKELVRLMNDAEIVSLQSFSRPLMGKTELDYAYDSSLKVRKYRYKMELALNGAGVKKMINGIAENEKFFFVVKDFYLKSIPQVNAELVPSLARTGVKDTAEEGKKDGVNNAIPDGLDLEELEGLEGLEGLDFPGARPKKKEKIEKALVSGGAVTKMQQTSDPAFKDTVYQLMLDVEWLVFEEVKSKSKNRIKK